MAFQGLAWAIIAQKCYKATNIYSSSIEREKRKIM